MKNKRLIQQGDVLFHGGETMPKNVKPKEGTRPGLITFAEGEVTGHHHSCVADGVALFEDNNGTMWVKTEQETTVTHQEHGAGTLSPGVYRIGIVREVDPFSDEIRDVAD
jgi:hypothetical protein